MKRIFDIVVLLGLILIIGVGIVTAKGMRQTADKQIESKSNIEFEVFLRSVTISSNVCPIVNGDKTFISIRNVPYSDLDVIAVKFMPKMVSVAANNKNGYVVVKDESMCDTYDIIVRVKDVATITKDGAVVGGNKVKIGLPITLEGKTYKFTGAVSDVKILDEIK